MFTVTEQPKSSQSTESKDQTIRELREIIEGLHREIAKLRGEK